MNTNEVLKDFFLLCMVFWPAIGGPLTFDLCIVAPVQERFGSWGLSVSNKLSTMQAVRTNVTLFKVIPTVACNSIYIFF